MQNYTSTPDVADKLEVGFPHTKSAFTTQNPIVTFFLYVI